MRISTNYIYTVMKRSMQDSIANLLKAEEVVATERKVNYLSDDPVASGRILDTEALISQNEQFISNTETASTIAALYDGAFDSAITLLTEAKELLLAETNSATSTETTREAARVEIVSLASQMVSVANLQYGDQYLFAGYADETAPFLDMYVTATAAAANTGGATVVYESVSDPALASDDTYEIRFTDSSTYEIWNTTTGAAVSTGNTYTSGEDIEFEGLVIRIEDTTGTPAAGDVFEVSTTPAGEYVGDSGVVRYEIEPDVWQEVNFTGAQVFQGVGLTDGVDIFALFDSANTALSTNDQTELSALLDEIDQAIEQLASQQSITGSRENLLSNTEDRLTDTQVNLALLLSDLRDVDAAEATTEMTQCETAYEAVLAAVAKIVQPTLLDFLD